MKRHTITAHFHALCVRVAAACSMFTRSRDTFSLKYVTERPAGVPAAAAGACPVYKETRPASATPTPPPASRGGLLARLPPVATPAEREADLRKLRGDGVRTSTKQNYRTELRLFAGFIRRELDPVAYADGSTAVFPAETDRDERRHAPPVALCAGNFRVFLHSCVRSELGFTLNGKIFRQ